MNGTVRDYKLKCLPKTEAESNKIPQDQGWHGWPKKDAKPFLFPLWSPINFCCLQKPFSREPFSQKNLLLSTESLNKCKSIKKGDFRQNKEVTHRCCGFASWSISLYYSSGPNFNSHRSLSSVIVKTVAAFLHNLKSQ